MPSVSSFLLILPTVFNFTSFFKYKEQLLHVLHNIDLLSLHDKLGHNNCAAHDNIFDTNMQAKITKNQADMWIIKDILYRVNM